MVVSIKTSRNNNNKAKELPIPEKHAKNCIVDTYALHRNGAFCGRKLHHNYGINHTMTRFTLFYRKKFFIYFPFSLYNFLSLSPWGHYNRSYNLSVSSVSRFWRPSANIEMLVRTIKDTVQLILVKVSSLFIGFESVKF